LSSWNAYIVPTDDSRCRGKGSALITHFQAVRLIAGFYNEELGWYAGCDGSVYPSVRFDYMQVYDSDAAHFIPSNTSGGYGAHCPLCLAELDEVIYRLREKWPESHQQKDMSNIQVQCPNCGVRTPLKDMAFEIDTAMTRFFVMLADGEPDEWETEFITDIERTIGCKVRVVMERM
jgi:hypothetical protein